MDIKDSYLHGTIGVVKSINVNADELTYTLADKQGTQVKVTLPKATVTTNGVMSNSDKVKLDNLNIDYFSNIVSYKISLPDNSGRTAYILVAKLTNWVDGKGSDYGFIGRIVGYRGGNLLNTCCYNLVAMLSSYVYNNATIYTKQLYVDKHTGYLEVLPCVVTYNGENYLALKKLGSGTEIYFEGAVKNVLPQSQWIVLNTPSGESLPDNMTVLHSANFTDAHSITTSKYFDGSSTKTLLHSGNHDGYTNKVKQNVTTNNSSYPLLLTPSGQTATTTTETYFDSGVTLNPSTNTISANISGNAATATSATNVNVSNHTTNDIDYPLVWSNENNTNSKSGNLLFKSYKDLVYNPKNKSVSVKGSISTNDGHFNYGLAFCENTAFNVTGLFVITLPVGWSNSMNSFEIDLYEYNSNNHSKIFISGYNYTSESAWIATSYHVVGSYSKKVRLGYQKYTDSAGNVSNRCCIILGDLDSEWNYPSVYLTAVYASLNNVAGWKSGYSINFVSVDETTFNSTYTNLKTLTRSNWGLGSTTYYGSLVPDQNASYNIGSSTNKFNNVYALVFNGAIKLPNNYWNTVGDDVAIGDCNVGGCLGVKSLLANANPGFYFFGESGTAIGKLEAVTNTLIKYNSVNFVLENGGTWGISISGTATKATLDGNGNVITNTYLPLTGGTLSGDITIKRNSSDAPSITLQRGETNDTFEDWRMANSGGYFKLQNRDSTGSWNDIVSVAPTTIKTISSKWSLLPLSTNTLNLGSSSLKWANVYTTNFDTTSLTVGDTLTVGGNAVFNGNTTFGDSVSDVTHVKGVLRIGSDNTRNYIAFYGTSGDNPGSFTNTYIGENLYGGAEKSELILFKGNDSDASSGYDRIRHIAAQHMFQVYTSPLNGAFDSVAASTSPTTILEINPTDLKAYKSIIPNSSNAINLGSSTLKWNTVYASTLIGNLNWSLITGAPNFAPVSHEHTYIAWAGDSRNTATLPSDYLRKFTLVGIKSPSAIGLTSDEAGTWVSLIGWKGYGDNTGPKSWELASGDNNKLYVRAGRGKYADGTGTETWGAWNTIAYTTTNFPSNQINVLTGYTKATTAGNIAATDTLNAALGKLEYKAHYAYDWIVGVTATDTDEYINKWSEIVGFLDSVKEGTDILDEFVTRKTDLTITAYKHFKNRVRIAGSGTALYLDSTSSINTIAFSIMKTDATEATRSFLIMRDDSVFKIANHNWNVEHLLLHGGNTHIKNGVITIAGQTITPITSLANYVTLNTALDITGLKTFKAASTKEDLIGVALKLGNSGWTSNMQTAVDFYNGAQYKVPNARISVLMNGIGDRGGTMIFSTLQKHASTNPNPNELTERFRISDTGTATFSCNVNIRNTGGNALSGMTNASLMYDSYTALNSTSYHPILGVKTNGGNVVNLGAYINGVGFYGYKNGRTENNWDWKFVFDSANGNLETTGGITLYTASGDSPALIFQRGAANDDLFDWSMKVSAGTLKFQLRESNGSWTDVLSLKDSAARNIVSAWHIIPDVTNGRNLGAISYKWANVYATTFTGNLSGNATTASSATKLDGNAETSYLRFRGLIARDYVDLTTYTAGAAAYKNYDNGIYGVEESGSRSLLIHFGNSNGSSSALEFWTQYPHNSRIKVRKTIDSNRVSGAWKELAWYSDIPTKTSQLTNDSGFLTLHQSLANYVTLNTKQTITGLKTFLSDGTIFTNGTHGARLLGHSNAGWLQLGQTSGENKVHHGKISGISAATLTSLTVSATASSFSGTVSATKEIKICTNGTNQTPKIVFDEYYNGTNNWKSEITSDFFGAKVCTETGFSHGLFITLGRNLTFSNLNVLDGDKAPIARISNVLGHWFKGNLEATENITANSFVKKNGTSSQFLKADGSVDSNTYVKPSDLPSLNQSGFNKILFERFNRGTITGGNPITEQDLVGKTLIDATLVDNFKSFNVGEEYLGRLTTYLYFSLATEFNTSAFSDDGSTLYLNDAVVVTLKSCVTTDITLNFVKGWNKIVWVFNENSGGDSAYFTPSIKTASNLLYMNAFPVATPEKVHQSYVSDASRRLESTTVIASTSYTLSNKAWADTTFNFTSLATGTYAIQVTSGTNLVASGIMSVYTNLSDTVGDEIPLHVYGTAGWRPYLRTYANKLQISSNDASATSRTVTIKIAQIL